MEDLIILNIEKVLYDWEGTTSDLEVDFLRDIFYYVMHDIIH